MANINLLPWREAQRSERNKVTLGICIVMWAIAGLIVLAGKAYMDYRIEHQQNRNAFLQSETDALAKIIREIEDLAEKRLALLARMEVIQNLQRNRAQIVHVFDDLVSKVPTGVYYDTITKNQSSFRIGGKAQSNARVSSLMRNLDGSDWFTQTNLNQVDVIDANGVAISQFDVLVKEERKDNDGDGEFVDTVR